jgi:glycosyltransferase involved in cell wall biosynthesis
MRIAFIGQKGIPATYGGVEDFTEEVAVRLAERGHPVTVYCRPYYSSSSESYRKVNLKRVKSIATKHLDAISHTFLCSINSLGKSFDIIVYQALGPASLCFIPRLWGGARVVTIIHALDWQREKWSKAAKLLLKAAESPAIESPHKVIVVSEALKSYFEGKFAKKIEKITPGVEPPVFREPDGIKQFGLEKERYILFLGRLVPEKGCHYLISAFEGIKTDMKLFIAGDGFFSEDYVQRLHSRSCPKIIFGGYVSEKIKQELLSNAYLYVLPSELEGLPQSVIEALSYGRCVLVSDIRANLETCGRWGHSFKNKDVEDLKRELVELINDKDLVKSEEKQRKEYVTKNFSWDKTVDELERIFRECLYLKKLNRVGGEKYPEPVEHHRRDEVLDTVAKRS